MTASGNLDRLSPSELNATTPLDRMRPSQALALRCGAIRDFLARYGFRQARVFGSVLTRTDTAESDPDVLVEPVRGTALGTLASLEDEAQQLMGVHVSVLTPGFFAAEVPGQGLMAG